MITLADRPFLEPKLRALGSQMIDYSFANLYLFRDVHAFERVQEYIRGVTRDGVKYLMLTCRPDQVDLGKMSGELLFPIPDEWLPFFPGCEKRADDSDSDYLYHTSKFAHYPGRHLSSRRNLVHQFFEKYDSHVTLPLTEERKADALAILEEWKQLPHGDARFTDYEPCKEAIEHLDALQLSGQITYVEGQPAGFLIGEALNSTTFVYHMAKGMIRFKGIYQYMFSNWAQRLEPQFEWINLGQDIGSEDIRHSKRSYQPDLLIKKWRIKLR